MFGVDLELVAEARDAGRKGGIASHRRRREQMASQTGSGNTASETRADMSDSVAGGGADRGEGGMNE